MTSEPTVEMTPYAAAEALKDVIGGYGFTWMTDADMRARGRGELGLRARALYHLGRGGALGDVPVEVVIAAEAFFPADVVRKHWAEGRAVMQPYDAALAFAGYCADFTRARVPDAPARVVGLLERVVDGAEPLGPASEDEALDRRVHRGVRRADIHLALSVRYRHRPVRP